MCPKTRADSGRNFGGPRVRRRQVVRATAPDVYDHVGVALRYIRGQFTAVRGPLNDGHLVTVNPLNAELNPICHLLALLGSHHILHVSRIRVKLLNTLCDILLIFRNPEARTFFRHCELRKERKTLYDNFLLLDAVDCEK